MLPMHPYLPKRPLRRFPSGLCALLAVSIACAQSPRIQIDGWRGDPDPTGLLTGAGYWQGRPGSWISFHLARSAPTLRLSWNDASGAWTNAFPDRSCCYYPYPTRPESYVVLGSANSSNGTDGTWDTLLRVEGNPVGASSRLVRAQGSEWIRFVQLAGSSNLDEVRFHDQDALGADSWFFVGNSITEESFKWYRPDTTFPEHVAILDGNRSPAIVRAGISGVAAVEVARSIDDYRRHAKGVGYWAIELGTNDALRNRAAGVDEYRSALIAIVEGALANEAVPIVARIPATNPASVGLQIDQGYLDVVDSVTRAYGLPAGPDFHGWFLAHPEELSIDGIHPNSAGAASIHRLWAEVALEEVAPPIRPAPPLGRPSAAVLVWRPGERSLDGIDFFGRTYRGSTGVVLRRR